MSDQHEGPASHKPGHGGHEEEHEEHVNHEAWVIPYADMLTLLMALFLMLWATSTVDQAKFAALASSLREAFEGQGTGELDQSVEVGSPGLLTGVETGVEQGDKGKATKPNREEMVKSAIQGAQSKSPAEAALQREQDSAGTRAQEVAKMTEVQKKIEAEATKQGVQNAVQFRQERRGLVVTVVADQVLFDSGSSDLRPEGARVLRVVGDALKTLPNDIMVEGHTDNSPIASSRYPSNWELSSYRGTTVLRNLVESVGISGERLASAGYGEMRPIADNDRPDGRTANRRVEIVVLANNQ